MIHRSIKGRVALAAACAAAAVILLSGGVVAVLVSRNERQSLDKRLNEQSQAVQGPVLSAMSRGTSINALELAARRPDVGTVIRVYSANQLIIAIGNTNVIFPAPKNSGYQTVSVAGKSWRMQTSVIQSQDAFTGESAIDPVTLQTAVPTDATDESVRTIRFRTVEVALLSALLAGIAGWYFGEVAVRPLTRLRIAAESVSKSRDLSVRVPNAETGPTEVVDLAHSLNLMLERLQESAASTEAALMSSRAFAANAAHELRTPLTSMQANLDVLAGNPDLPANQHEEIVQSIIQEQSRLVRLLEALHTLALGEVLRESQRETVDLADLVGVAVEAACRRFPSIEYHFDVPDESMDISGWPEGLRVMVDNLLTNAARHGGQHVTVSLDRNDSVLCLVVDDDGPGVPADEREVIFERFQRGKSVTSSGSGLGLALVAQQARIHGGQVAVTESPQGGARFKVTFASI